MLAIAFYLSRTQAPDASLERFGWCCLAFTFGGLVGFAEILSRYRDEPLRAVAHEAGLFYLSLNGVISLAAFLTLAKYPTSLLGALDGDPLAQAIAAGFGSMALFRAKLFTFRADDGQEYSIGPALVFETILRTVDREIDRERAANRQTKVYEMMGDLEDFERIAPYLISSLLSFQNLSQAEKTEYREVIDEYRREKTWPDALKIMAVGYAFLTIAGEENFAKVIKNLRAFLATEAAKEVRAAAARAATPPPAVATSTPPPAGGPTP